MYWKVYKAEVIAKEKTAFTAGLDKFVVDGNYTALLNIEGNTDTDTDPLCLYVCLTVCHCDCCLMDLGCDY